MKKLFAKVLQGHTIDIFKNRLGLIRPALLKKYLELAQTSDEMSILSAMIELSNKSSLLIKLDFITYFILILINILLIYGYGYLLEVPYLIRVIFFVILLALTLVQIFFITIPLLDDINILRRYTTIFLDKILAITFYRFRPSLAQEIPYIPEPKKITNDIASAFLTSSSVSHSSAVSFSIKVGTVIIMLYEILILRRFPFLLIATVLAIIGLQSLLRFLAKRFIDDCSELIKIVDQLDNRVLNLIPSIAPANFNLRQTGVIEKIYRNVQFTSYINTTHRFIGTILPFVSIFGVLIFPSTFSLSTIVMYVLLLALGSSIPISYWNDIATSQKKQLLLEAIADKALLSGDEMTPNSYKSHQKIIRENSSRNIAHKVGIAPMSNKSLIVKDLRYKAGRRGQESVLRAKKLSFPPAKVSIVFAPSGIGKSILGRLLTMRYSNFTADFIGKGKYDFRFFKTLQNAQSRLHFSLLREIDTSYRNVIAEYVRSSQYNNMFFDQVCTFSGKFKSVLDYFQTYSEYYGKISMNIIKYLGNIKDIDINNRKKEDFNEAQRDVISDLYRAFSKEDDFLHFIGTLETDPNFTIYLCMASLIEYVSFMHLKEYIPEASQFFVDAILSEPPISQGQRRRILFAIDIFYKGEIFIADEPLANLDFETAKALIESCVNYSKKYKVPVVILDQTKRPNVLNYLKEKNALGRIYTYKGRNIVEV